jgi:hypothetical protein
MPLVKQIAEGVVDVREPKRKSHFLRPQRNCALTSEQRVGELTE